MAIASQIQSKSVSGVRNVAISFEGLLDDSELLTGTPTVTEVGASSPQELTFSNIAVNTAILTINGLSVAIGEAVQFKVTGGIADTPYKITITVSTDATPAQTLIGTVRLSVLPDA